MIYSRQSFYKIGKKTAGVDSQMYDEQSELARLRDLDPEVISAIHNRYFPVVYRFAIYRVSDEAIAEDISSEAFTRLLEAINNNRGPKTNIKGWLLGTTSNLVNDHFRTIYSHQEEQLSSDITLETEQDPLKFAEANDVHAEVRKALNTLTDEQQQVIALRFGDELSLEETAQIMGKRINAIKALQFRALVSLRKKLGM